MQTVLTFSRRYATGTSVIVDKIAKKYDMPVYGKDYICRELEGKESMKEQAEAIKDLAKESCIIVGRGACDVLSGLPYVVNVYIYANKKDRIKRAMEKEGLSEKDAEKRVEEVDAERINFYEENSGKFWGDMDNYDIILDSSTIGIENCADIICNYLEEKNFV